MCVLSRVFIMTAKGVKRTWGEALAITEASPKGKGIEAAPVDLTMGLKGGKGMERRIFEGKYVGWEWGGKMCLIVKKEQEVQEQERQQGTIKGKGNALGFVGDATLRGWSMRKAVEGRWDNDEWFCVGSSAEEAHWDAKGAFSSRVQNNWGSKTEVETKGDLDVYARICRACYDKLSHW